MILLLCCHRNAALSSCSSWIRLVSDLTLVSSVENRFSAVISRKPSSLKISSSPDEKLSSLWRAKGGLVFLSLNIGLSSMPCLPMAVYFCNPAKADSPGSSSVEILAVSLRAELMRFFLLPNLLLDKLLVEYVSNLSISSWSSLGIE